MVCNDLVMPVLLRWQALRLHRAARTSPGCCWHPPRRDRRSSCCWATSISALAGEAYALVGDRPDLVRRRGPVRAGHHRRHLLEGRHAQRARIAGLCAGFAVWIYTLLLPSFAKSGWLPLHFLSEGLFGIELLKPQQLFGLAGLDEITPLPVLEHARQYRLLRRRLAGGPAERRRARPGDPVRRCLPPRRRRRGLALLARQRLRCDDLLPLIGRFLGPERAQRGLPRLRPQRGAWLRSTSCTADAELVHYAETLLAGRHRQRLGARDGGLGGGGGAARRSTR